MIIMLRLRQALFLAFLFISIEAQTCENKNISKGIPHSGFILANVTVPIVGKRPSLNRTIIVEKALRILSKARIATSCERIRFIDAPSFVGDMEFRLVPDELANGKPYYTNDRYYLSFVAPTKSSRPHGTWIIGNDPGMDSGVGYLKSPHPSYVPIFSSSSPYEWEWIINKKWTKFKETNTLCLAALEEKDVITAEYIGEKQRLEKVNIHVDVDGSGDGDTKRIYYEDVASSQQLPIVFLYDKTIIPLGTSVDITDQNTLKPCQGHLINSEFLYTYWRLMFHCYNNNVTEVMVNMGDQGIFDGSVYSPPTPSPINPSTPLHTANVGDFYWLWYSPINASYTATQNVLVQCIATEGGKIQFRYWDSDRRDIMGRSLLSYLTDIVIYEDGVVTLGCKVVQVESALSLGRDVVAWVRAYLLRHEGRFGGFSSCFLYHAAIAMPPQLLYLAEMVCVLMGSKPLAMVQFASSGSDHQWKFPLTGWLTQKLVSYSQSHPEFPIGFTCFVFRSDETWIVYHKNSSHLVDELLPYHEAQALHIAPYLDNSATDKENTLIFETQIYNSWWNGYVLGYPEHFIDSYCTDFHVDLPQDDKSRQIARAKRTVKEHFETMRYPSAGIRLGLNQEVHSEFWDSLQSIDGFYGLL